MTERPRPVPPQQQIGGETADSQQRGIDSVTLLGGQRELIIRHGTETYRLRLTASDKLILTK
jgi:hemin uptake protein HemP